MTPFWNKIVKFAFCPSITHKDDNFAKKNSITIGRKINWLTRANITHPVIHTVYVQSSLDFGKNVLLIFYKPTCWVGDFYSASSLKQQSAGGHVISHPDADQPVFAVNIQYPYIVEKYIIYLHEL
jgi:hypothetical protein